MFRLWCKIIDDSGHLLKSTTIENNDSEMNRTRKIFDGIKKACYEFDLSEPIWLDANVSEFKNRSKVAFVKDNFIEEIDFYAMEIQVIEED